jgi:hypothetical protein
MKGGIIVGLIFFFAGVSVMLFGIALLSYTQSSNSIWLSIKNIPWISLPIPEWISIPLPIWISVSHTPYPDMPWTYMILGIGGLILGTIVIFITSRIQRIY